MTVIPRHHFLSSYLPSIKKMVFNVFNEYDRPITDCIHDPLSPSPSPSPSSSDRPLPNDRSIAMHERWLKRKLSSLQSSSPVHHRRRNDLPRSKRPICLDERRDNNRRGVNDRMRRHQRQFQAATMAERRRREVRRREEDESSHRYENAIREVNKRITIQNMKKNRKERMKKIPTNVHEKALLLTRSAIRDGTITSQLTSTRNTITSNVKVETSPPPPPPPPTPTPNVKVETATAPTHPKPAINAAPQDVDNSPPQPMVEEASQHVHHPPSTYPQPSRNNSSGRSGSDGSSGSGSGDNLSSSPDDVNNITSTSRIEKVARIANNLKRKNLPTYVDILRNKTPQTTPSKVTRQFKATKAATMTYEHMKHFYSWIQKAINNMKKEEICVDHVRLSEVALESGTDIGDPSNRVISSQVQSLIHQDLPLPPFDLPRDGLPDDFVPLDFVNFGSLLHDLARKYDTILAICPMAIHASFFEIFDFLS